MGLIQNYNLLALTPERKTVLDVIESGLHALQPEEVFHKNISLRDDILIIQDKQYSLRDYQRVFLIGFGKGSARNSFYIEQLLTDSLTDGYVIDVIEQNFKKVHFTKGTHPLPSMENITFTKNVVETFTHYSLTTKDLVLVVICGGGSAMFELPNVIKFEQKLAVDKVLLQCGANIKEMNIVRKHLSLVKGGGLAKILYPAVIATLVYSDVAGNDLSTIASGPTVKDPTTLEDVKTVLHKFPQLAMLPFSENAFSETPKEDIYFERVTPFVLLSNLNGLQTMQKIAKEKGYEATIFSDAYQNDANIAGQELIDKTQPGQILLAGGETTVKVHGDGQGGRNQQLVLAALDYVGDNVTIASVGTDGWDNSHNAGAIGDLGTLEKAKTAGIDPETFLADNNSLAFFEKTEDAIVTGKLPSNVADLIIVLKK